MGLILDTSVLSAGERQRRTLAQVLSAVYAQHGELTLGLSTVSVAELTHGIYRARDPEQRYRRKIFIKEALTKLPVYPLTVEIASLAGQIEGEQAVLGNSIAFQDLVIGATALHLNYSVLTHNTRHFTRIPGLTVLTP